MSVSATAPPKAKFPLGNLVSTPGALEVLTHPEIMSALSRHITGDWGEVDAEDKRANDQSLIDGSRLLSAYRSQDGTKFWIITEADRSVTTVLLPEEY
ncbi:MAG: hypothetical protein K1X78_10130 [Verrucomicrobiaceae bacterium]|nr:hypothetical protein [Verrucomicrobiaceae bacterium]